MDKEYKESLEIQFEWTKKQIDLLDQMEFKLREMKKVVEYAAESNLPFNDREKLNQQTKCLNDEYILLEQQRYTVLFS